MRPSLTLFLATGFYSGYAPRAPGTAGSVVGVIVWWLIFLPLLQASTAAALILFAILFAAGCVIAGRAEEILGQRDSPMIVIDEILGMSATLFFHPATWPFIIGGFVAFRFFDILKPPPVRQIDRFIKGGTGVMLDDIAAAVYASLALAIVSLVL